jgi:hypothetical protein
MPRSRTPSLHSLAKRKAEFIEPMECALVTKLPEEPDWFFPHGVEDHPGSPRQVRSALQPRSRLAAFEDSRRGAANQESGVAARSIDRNFRRYSPRGADKRSA